MARLIAHWVLSALCILLVARFVPGISVSGFGAALLAAVIIGFVNGTLGFLLKILTFPLIVLTFGIFWIIINALMLKFASLLVPGFNVRGFAPAFWGAIILSLLNIAVRQVLRGFGPRPL
jgi:putative membrane protein